MAKTAAGYWGIDVGQCGLKAIRLELRDGKPVATAYDYIEHPKILSQPDADPDSLIREALEKFLSRNPVGKDEVAVSIAGQSGLARFVKLPPVEEKKIPEIVKFEAKQQIPFPLDEVVWDYQKIAGGEAVGGFAMETEVGLFAMKRDVIARALAPFAAVKSEVHLVQMAPLALCNFATYEVLKKGGPDPVEGEGAPLNEGEADDTPKGKKRCAVVLDIGTDNSNLIITDGGKVIWQRPVPLGGNHFTRALTKELKLTFAKAEHLKRNAAKSPDLAQILRALRPVLTEFVGEAQRSLGYFTNTHRDAHVAYMVGVGNAFRLPGLQKYLAEKLSLDVRKPARLDRIGGDTVLADPNFQENLLTFPVAIGLALQGLGLARLQTNLLPQEIRVERMIRAKKPWAAAAAAGLLIGAAGVAYGYSAQLTAVTDPGLADAIKKAESAVSKQKEQAGDKSSREATVASTAAEVKSIITGNDERLNWVRFNEVLSAALPRPADPDLAGKDPKAPGNLTDPEQIPYWSGSQEQRAYQKYKERMSQGIQIEKLFDPDLAEHLATVNIEAVYCRYADQGTAQFFTNADLWVKKELSEDIADTMLPSERDEDGTFSTPTAKRYKPKPPEGPAWVFELRGYTYHKQGQRFVKATLLKNLQKFGIFAEENYADPNPRRPAIRGTEKVGKIIPGGKDPIVPPAPVDPAAPAPAPAGDPAAPAPAPAAPAPGAGPTVSHAFLLFCRPFKQTPATPAGVFDKINSTFIDGLLLGTVSATPTGGPGGEGAPPGDAGIPLGPAVWKPLTGSGGAMGIQAGAGVPTGGMALPSFGGSQGATFNPGSAPPPPGTDPRLAGRDRYEFVVCFLWREPTAASGAAAPAAPAAPAPAPPPAGP